MQRLRAALIGAGFIGPAHVEAVRRLGYVDVVALVGSDRERAEAKAAALHIPRAYSDLTAILADPDIDVIHNCTPNHLHFRINQQILAAGKHVISEKPLAVTTAEADQLARLAAEAGVVNAVCFNYRAYPLVQEMRARIARGDIGDVRLIHGGYLQDWLLYATDDNWRVDPAAGGASRAVADIGSHWVDTVEFVTGLPVTEVMADLGTFFAARRTEDCATVLLRFANGAKGSMTISQISPGRKNRLHFEVDGSQEAFAWDQEHPSDLWIGRRSEANGHLLRDPALLTDEARPFAHYPGGHNEGWPDGLKNLCAQVYAYIAAGKDPRRDPPPFPTFATGARIVRIVSAILASSRQGAWMPVDAAL
ncbi:MAG: dehydrogenase [Firmicutes bacterium]|nr:dehydrogenase [Bacillota bacterium]